MTLDHAREEALGMTPREQLIDTIVMSAVGFLAIAATVVALVLRFGGPF
jgi:hypothetical protein